jgi:hypothetical protein
MRFRPPASGSGATSGPAGAWRRASLALALAGVGALASGCSSIHPIEPWVKPYERERLADPIMQVGGADVLPAKHLEHVYTVREAAHGGTGVQGGGCGCN